MPRFALPLALNASKCMQIESVDVLSPVLFSAHFGGCDKLKDVPAITRTLKAAPSWIGGAGGYMYAPAAVSAPRLPSIEVLHVFRCPIIVLRRLQLTRASAPALTSVVLHGVLELAELYVDGLSAPRNVELSGCHRLASVSVPGCPALRRVDLRANKATLTHVLVAQCQEGEVVGLRGTWKKWNECGRMMIRSM